jgi:hypothetical protein
VLAGWLGQFPEADPGWTDASPDPLVRGLTEFVRLPSAERRRGA